MKKILLLCFLQCCILCFSQKLRPVAQKVSDYHAGKTEIKKYDLFEVSQDPDKLAEYRRAATDITVISLKSAELKRLISEKPEFIEISFPFNGNRQITVEMYKNQIFTSNFKVVTNKGKTVNYTPGVYYQGIVKGNSSSVVAFSFFDNDVAGVASTPELGNIVLGKAKNADDFVSYSDSKLTGTNPFICGIDELKENQGEKISYDPGLAQKKTLTQNCVRIYYEICYKPYQNNGSNTTTVTNWITAIHNNIATLYTNDDIRTALNEVYIWTTADPYTGNPSSNLAKFSANRQVFNGDLAHLINAPSTTSVAYLNSLCKTYAHAYSGINQTYNNVPVYSWTIQAMTHEMGHSLGSPHTHACAWNGNNTPIDWCGPTAMPSIITNEGLICTSNVLPPSGTIMSYCHLMSGIGINFSNGFGDQPAALIRNTIDSKPCLGTNCTTSCIPSISSVIATSTTQNSASILITDAISSSWKYKVTQLDGTAVTAGNTNTANFNIANLQPGTYYKIEAVGPCANETYYQKSGLFLTDAAWCEGVQFLDTGGANANYGNNQEIVKTFYPASGSSMTMTFTEFGTEQDYDFMYVYNGPSTASPLFPNGNKLSGTTIPGPFTSTDPSGAITVKFVSDPEVNGIGWKAGFSCAVLGVEDVNVKNNTVGIYPNPAGNTLTISSKEALKAYRIYDESGRMVISDISLKGNKQEISLSAIQTGNYVITIETEKQTVNKKLIKQ
ncbi:M12 family metallo-peptidase [Chryseobacterium arthrosphaerae]|uniref:M12 family metallo-peptidase n=1 Tax=Chryseobacterium arthrosphaerae TaxID=651561 RepID=UPI001BAF113E|nr:M12 family metallo-peptidase [Chryseobacterium arthrosphaerae]QUY57670.1 T9SS type A sorting domain-containing protein [Chryseobacterium arthrosphaerae]